MDDGFTLIETLLALLISAVALTAGTQLLVVSVVAAQNARDESIATWLAQSRFESLRADVTAIDGADLVAPTGASDPARGRYSRTWTVFQSGATRTIRVEVRSRSGRVSVCLAGAVLVAP